MTKQSKTVERKAAGGVDLQRFVGRVSLRFPLRPMEIPDVEVRLDLEKQTLSFRLPGGQVMTQALWMVCEGAADQYGRGFDDVIQKCYTANDKADLRGGEKQ